MSAAAQELLRWLAWNSVYAAIALSGVALLLRFWKRAPASVAHLCWWIVFVRLVLPVDFGMPLSFSNLVPGVTTGIAVPEVLVSYSMSPVTTPGGPMTDEAVEVPSWIAIAGILWLLGASASLAWLFARRRRFTALARSARAVDDPIALSVLEDCRTALGLRTSVRLVHGEGPVSPFTTGVLKPVIWIPTSLLENLDGESLRCLIAHELVHVARKDDLLIRVQLVLESLFFFNPAVWLAGNQLAHTREQACDQRVVAVTGVAPRDYGRSLVETLRLGFITAEPLPGFGGRKRSLEMRLRALSSIPRKTRLALVVPLAAAWLLLPMARTADARIDAPAERTVGAIQATAVAPASSAAQVSPSASTGDAIRISGDIVPPKVIKRINPTYPPEARKEGVVGVVILETVIDENGQVSDVRPLKDLPLGLTEAAMDAVKQWEFEPATLNGVPVKVFFNLTINFKLDSGLKFANPLPEGKTTSPYGDRRELHGETMEIHSGIDLAAPSGTTVRAAADGVVLTATTYDPERANSGTFVIIDHGSAMKTFYSHLDTLNVAAGQKVKSGDAIGTVGMTGVSTGPHLHFEVWSGDHPVDPGRYLGPRRQSSRQDGRLAGRPKPSNR